MHEGYAGGGHASSLVQAFDACGSHDNNIRKAGEDAVKRLSKDAHYVQQLLLISISNCNETSLQVRRTLLGFSGTRI